MPADIHIDSADINVQTLTFGGETGEYVQLVVFVAVAEADRLVGCRKARRSGMYAADCRPLTHAAADAITEAKKRTEA